MTRENYFGIKNDYDFYCFLKFNLPKGYSVISEPKAAYYSEWLYDYRVMKGSSVIATYAGDYRQTEKGSLVREAEKLMADIRAGRC